MKEYLNLGKRLFPICRSITGNGVRKTLIIIRDYLPKLKIFEVKSGTKVFDWKVPPEWNVKNAYVKDKYEKKIIDFKNNNLHLVGYSIPTKKLITKKELFLHLHTLKQQPNAIPYVTSYYKKYWGFCVSHKDKEIFTKKYRNNKDLFEVNINSLSDKKGSLSYGELVIPGQSKKEIFISTYICHPSMANNELSGPLVAISLARYFSSIKKNKKTLRFIFVPETIGSITYLRRNYKKLKKNVIGGYNLTCIGDERRYSFLPTKNGNTLSDNAAMKAFDDLKLKYKTYSFLDRGSDERQYNSPGIDLPIASIMRSKYGTYPEYHTSLDDFNLVTEKGLEGGFKIARRAIAILMNSGLKNKKFNVKKVQRKNRLIPKNLILCEPQMSKRGLYPSLSTKKSNQCSKKSVNFMNFLQYADGKNDLVDISNLIKLSFEQTSKIFKILLKKKLISASLTKCPTRMRYFPIA